MSENAEKLLLEAVLRLDPKQNTALLAKLATSKNVHWTIRDAATGKLTASKYSVTLGAIVAGDDNMNVRITAKNKLMSYIKELEQKNEELKKRIENLLGM